MSTINTTNLQADSLVAQNGNTAKRVDIPSIRKELPLAKLYYNSLDANPIVGNSYNVSSLIQNATNQYTVNLINSNESYDGGGIQGVAGSGHDQINSRYLEFFYLQNSSTTTALYLQVYQYKTDVGTLAVTQLDVLVF